MPSDRSYDAREMPSRAHKSFEHETFVSLVSTRFELHSYIIALVCINLSIKSQRNDIIIISLANTKEKQEVREIESSYEYTRDVENEAAARGYLLIIP